MYYFYLDHFNLHGVFICQGHQAKQHCSKTTLERATLFFTHMCVHGNPKLDSLERFAVCIQGWNTKDISDRKKCRER
jgi:hypothetical protein